MNNLETRNCCTSYSVFPSLPLRCRRKQKFQCNIDRIQVSSLYGQAFFQQSSFLNPQCKVHARTSIASKAVGAVSNAPVDASAAKVQQNHLYRINCPDMSEEDAQRLIASAMKEHVIPVGRRGVTKQLADAMHTCWRVRECVKLEVDGDKTVFQRTLADWPQMMAAIHELSGGRVLWRSGRNIVVYRGRDYVVKPVINKHDSLPPPLNLPANYTPRGTMVSGAGARVYTVAEGNPKFALLVLHDIFGLDQRRFLRICDALAEGGNVAVLAPDLPGITGAQPLQPSQWPPPATDRDFVPYVANHLSWQRLGSTIVDLLTWTRTQYPSCQNIGMLGFGSGAYLALCAGADEAAASSLVGVALASANTWGHEPLVAQHLRVPVAVVAGRGDPMEAIELNVPTKLRQRGYFKRWGKVDHGYCGPLGQWGPELNRQMVNATILELRSWLESCAADKL